MTIIAVDSTPRRIKMVVVAVTTTPAARSRPMSATTNLTDLDIRDIEMGATYWVVVSDAYGGRCLMLQGAPMFRAAWRTEKSAKAAAKQLGGRAAGFLALKQIKQ
jgi:hypothetical protein